MRIRRGDRSSSSSGEPSPPAEPTKPSDALTYAKRLLKHQRKSQRFNLWCFVFFQGLTILASAAATVVAVANPKDISDVWRATPPALATLAASFIAAGGFRAEWRKHRTAAERLDYEILKYENKLAEYRPDEPRPQPHGVDVFLSKVYEISATADNEPEEAAKKPPNGQPSGNDNPPGAQ